MIVIAAIAMSLIVIALIGTELGYHFFMKREFQKAADLAALAGTQKLAATNNCGLAASAASTNAGQNLPAGIAINAPECGNWQAGQASAGSTGCFAGTDDHFLPGGTPLNAVRVRITQSPPALLGFLSGDRTICVQAVAAQQQPQAALNIRSTLAVVDASQSPLLNAVIGGLLGGNLNLGFAGWNGLLNTNISLLEYLDALAVKLNISAGNYDSVLQTEVTTGQLLEAAITVLQRQNAATPGATLDAAINAIGAIIAQIKISPTPLKLGELLNLQSGTPAAGLEATLQVFKLVEGVVQLANSHSAAAATVNLPIPGLGSVLVKTKVIEPPQVSAIGNPALAQLDPLGPDQIFVRTAQIRTLISVEIGGITSVVNDLLNAIFAQLAPITTFINDVLHLNLVQAVGNFLGGVACPLPLLGPCRSATAIYAKVAPATHIDVGIEAASGQAYVFNYSCASELNKSLIVPAKTAAVTIYAGRWGVDAASAEAAFFSPPKIPKADPVSLIEIGNQTVKPDACLLTLCSGLNWKKGSTWIADRKMADFALEAALGLRINSLEVAGTSENLTFQSPIPENLPEISQQPYYQSISATNILGNLAASLSNIEILSYKSTSSGILGNLLFDTTSLLNSVVSQLTTIVSNLLSPLLDPLVNFLLQTLGVNVAATEVGARLSCKQGAELVY
ncbi:putative membrane protein [Variovorax boronicumulans]|uniref:Membrane protein n=1 Tax=Variovorax boronicumulans TaxID=436515 RepID=A0AAW8CY17_9BURK|nr:TadG family pilus assembly protein [Variovorax boronicumulans]MDP9892526.1 putative membrane protein [Variovorax boronicumulans]MDQ0051994.1 putative membrane protein [Variovorax boronicumulans]